MASQGWSFSRLTPTLPRPQQPKNTVGPPPQATFEPEPANVQVASNIYHSLSLLGIPVEVRQVIYRRIYAEIRNHTYQPWYKQTTTQYDGLHQTCRQLYHETELFWRRSIVPQNRLIKFIDQPYSQEQYRSFTSLTLEIPFNMSDTFFSQGARMLQSLAPILRDLKIFFIGNDAYGVKTSIHGCGSKMPMPVSTSRKLCIDGQGFEKRLPFIHTLLDLQQLRTLVLSNLNLPLLEAHVIKDKPFLEKLYLINDPRSTIHVPYNMRNSPRHLAPADVNYPAPVKELQISANAALTSLKVALKCSRSIEHLTWIVPDVSRQDTGRALNWYLDTATMLMNLRTYSKKLHTLRLCMEGSIREDHYMYGQIIGGFKQHVPYLPLKRLELHLSCESPWMSHEFIECLPSSLERLYLSDSFIPADSLLKFLNCIYYDRPCCGTGYNADCKQKQDCDEEWQTGCKIVPNGSRRTDFIPTKKMSLGFVSYTYNVSSDPNKARVQRTALLTINGRLLDRAHNKHLASLNGGHIKPKIYRKSKNRPVVIVTEHAAIEKQVAKLKAPSVSAIRHNMEELSEWIYKDNENYFGMEDEAEEVFRKEIPAKLNDLPPRSYPTEVDANETDHWICP